MGFWPNMTHFPYAEKEKGKMMTKGEDDLKTGMNSVNNGIGQQTIRS